MKILNVTTWADLLSALQTLTPEQLARNVAAGNEGSFYSDVDLRITTEPHYELEPHEPWVGEAAALAEIGPEELAKCDREEAGAVFLFVE